MIALAITLLLAAPAAQASPASITPAIAPQTAAPLDPAAVALGLQLLDLIHYDRTLDQAMKALGPIFAQSMIGSVQADPEAKAAFNKLITEGKGGQAQLVIILSEEFTKSFRARYPILRQRAAEEYARTFSAEELRYVVAFYKTEAGQKYLSALPQLQQNLSKVGGEIGREVGEETARKAMERAVREMLPQTGNSKI